MGTDHLCSRGCGNFESLLLGAIRPLKEEQNLAKKLAFPIGPFPA